MSLSSLTGAQKDELMDQVKQQIAVANAQELLTVIIQPFLPLLVIKTFKFSETDRKVFQEMHFKTWYFFR